MADEAGLFEVGEAAAKAAPVRHGRKRLRTAVRDQVAFHEATLDELLPDDHQARAVWEYVCGLDLSPILAGVRAVEDGPGQAPADPRIPLALWLYATLRGVGSARELDRLCSEHVAYRWLRGGVSTNYHTLSDFRVAHPDVLDRLLTDGVAGLMAEGLVTLDRVAQDGVKVRAAAGAASFRRGPSLEKCRQEAEAQVAALEAELDADPGAGTRRSRAARERAATERAERVRRALGQLPAVAAGKTAKDREKARVSTTDPDARVMKMGDGGYRPAFNVQLATDADSQVVTGVAVTNAGGDQGQLEPMVGQHEERYGKRPKAVLADGGYVKVAAIEAVEGAGTAVYAPVPEPKDKGRDPHARLPDDGPGAAAWRARMGTEAAKEAYKERAATAECVNAQARNRGLRQFNVRGLAKARAVALLYALAHNLARARALRAAKAAAKG